MYPNKGTLLLLTVLGLKWCYGDFNENVTQPFDVDSFENFTMLNASSITLDSLEKLFDKRSTTAFKLDGDNGFTYLNIGILMASHLGELPAQFIAIMSTFIGILIAIQEQILKFVRHTQIRRSIWSAVDQPLILHWSESMTNFWRHIRFNCEKYKKGKCSRRSPWNWMKSLQIKVIVASNLSVQKDTRLHIKSSKASEYKENKKLLIVTSFVIRPLMVRKLCASYCLNIHLNTN